MSSRSLNLHARETPGKFRATHHKRLAARTAATKDDASLVHHFAFLCLLLFVFVVIAWLIAPSMRHTSLADYYEDIGSAGKNGAANNERLAHVTQFPDGPTER